MERRPPNCCCSSCCINCLLVVNCVLRSVSNRAMRLEVERGGGRHLKKKKKSSCYLIFVINSALSVEITRQAL